MHEEPVKENKKLRKKRYYVKIVSLFFSTISFEVEEIIHDLYGGKVRIVEKKMEEERDQ